MRIRSLHLQAYGHFTDRVVELGDAAGRLHVLFGPNEVGKSTALAALSDLLFGFPHLAAYGFRHEPATLRVGAELENDAGSRLLVFRRKGRVGTLLDAAGRALDDGVLEGFLGRADRALFEKLFGLDHLRLRKGGEDLLAGEGEIAQSLFEAGAGVLGVKRIMDGLEAEASEIFTERGAKPRLNAALRRHSEVQRHIREKRVSGEQWRKRREDLAVLEASGRTLRAQLEEKERERSRCERLRRTMPKLASRRQAAARLDELRGVPDLSPRAEEERAAAERALEKAGHERAAAAGEIERLRREIEVLEVSDEILREESEIAALVEDRAVARKAAQDLPRREAEARQVAGAIEGLLREAGLRLAPDAAEAGLPARPAVSVLRALVNQRNALDGQLAGAARVRGEAESALAALERDLAGLAPVPELEPLRAALGDVRSEGAIEQQASEAARDERALAAEVERAAASLPRWTGSLDRLARLPLPDDETIARREQDRAGLASALETARARAGECRERLVELDAEVERLTAAGAVPSDAELAAARERRDAAWRLLRRGFVDGREDVAAVARELDAERSLPEAYEASVGRADRLADQLRVESDRVSRYRDALVARREATRLLEEREAELGRAAADLRAFEVGWSELWKDAGIEPGAPVEMAGWVRRRAVVMEKVERLVERRRAREDLGARADGARRRILSELAGLGAVPSPRDGPAELASLLREAERVVERAKELETARSLLEGRIADGREAVRNAGARLGEVERQLEDWRQAWTRAVEPLGRSGEAPTAEVESVLGLVDELRKSIEKRTDLEGRIRAMSEDVARHGGRVREVAARSVPELASLGAEEAVGRLAALLDAARKARDDRARLDREVERQTATERAAAGREAEAEAVLGRLCRRAGCERPEELPAIEARARERGLLLAERARLEGELLRDGDGRSLDDLVAEAGGPDVDPDALPGRIEALAAEIREIAEQSQQLGDELGQLKKDIEALEAGDEAAGAAQEGEEILASIRGDAERWARLKLGASVLRRTMECYRERQQGPLLGRASALFARLTAGGFARLLADLDERDRPELLGVRASGERVRIPGMSEGTRDQLFLALRLAAIDEYLGRNESLPFVADDLLVQFDDERAAAAISVLHELTRRTQVLFFTHHAHLVEIARRTLAVGAFDAQDLDARSR